MNTSAGIVSRLCPRDLFEQFRREGFTIANPASSLTNLTSVDINGGCMEPVLRAGDVIFYEEGAEPRDGDIILFDVKSEIVERARSSSPTAKAWEEKFGQPWPTRQAKLIKYFAGEWWIVCNESMARHSQYAERIVGVVRYIHRVSAPVHCSGIEPGAATDVGAIEVNSDSYNFPNPTGPQDRSFTAFTYTNVLANDFEIEVSVTGNRKVTTPSGLSGTTDVISWISTLNTTDSVLVATTQDYMTAQIDDQPASTVRSFIESTVFVVTIPSGKTFEFTPKCRVFPVVGSTGNINLTTTAYSMRITAAKR